MPCGHTEKIGPSLLKHKEIGYLFEIFGQSGKGSKRTGSAMNVGGGGWVSLKEITNFEHDQNPVVIK